MPICNHCLHCHREGQVINLIKNDVGVEYINVEPVECYCHRYAPRPNVFDNLDDMNRVIWPQVQFDSWCGEFEPNPYPIATFDYGKARVTALYVGTDESEDFVAEIGICADGFYCERKGEREYFESLNDALVAAHTGINSEVFPGEGR